MYQYGCRYPRLWISARQSAAVRTVTWWKIVSLGDAIALGCRTFSAATVW
jgi:hypothetical protein